VDAGRDKEGRMEEWMEVDGGREGGRERKREGAREGEKQGGREGAREGAREGGGERLSLCGGRSAPSPRSDERVVREQRRS
jgi:hypothetical protein